MIGYDFKNIHTLFPTPALNIGTCLLIKVLNNNWLNNTADNETFVLIMYI